MKSPTKQLRRKYMRNQLATTTLESNVARSKLLTREKKDNLKSWSTLFRRNPHIYVDAILGIKLKPFQQIMLWLMFQSEVFWTICSRGLSKSFMCALGAVVKALLYPYSEIVITASTIEQANKFAQEKILNELIKKLSSRLLWMYNEEKIVITRPEGGGFIVNFPINGSIIKILPCQDSARGSRATMLIYEECRLLKKSLLDSIFEKMAHPRQAKFLENPEYANNPRWVEECQSIYITSARYSYEWYANAFRKSVTQHYINEKVKYEFFAGDIHLSISNGLKTWNDYVKGYSNSRNEFMMEDLNIMLGENESSFFEFETFKKYAMLEKNFVPPKDLDVATNKIIDFPEKGEDEIRMVCVDFAFANKTSRGHVDNTIIMCVSGHWNVNRFEKHLDHIECMKGGDNLKAGDRVKLLKYDYNADYVVMDQRSGGEVIYNHITQPLTVPTRGRNGNYPGLTVIDNMKYHQVPEAKVEDLKARTVDPNADACIIPIVGTLASNSDFWMILRRELDNGGWKFLYSADERQDELITTGEYYNLTSEELAEDLMPFYETEALFQEAMELRTVLRKDKVSLEEPPGKTKDRVVILSYGNYIFSKIENAWNQQLFDAPIVDYDVIDCVW